ncbi:MAG TPA: phytoene/squalene synthase family protein [Solirubrobacteraceae bacterium]|nr:phytoene/squalene synthase family protein [Solirubrobacteraceae bacterium]
MNVPTSPSVNSPLVGRNATAADGSTFAPGLRLLPAETRKDVERLYGVLRTLDDLVDEDDPRAMQRVRAFERWAGERQADSPETRALAELERRHPLPRDALLHFCEGMRHDITRASIDTEEDFARYCQQAGGSVGIMLVSLLGVTGSAAGDKREAEAKMATLGRAMQVTNILRDIDEDLSNGRLYIARTTIERFGFPAPGGREALLREQIAHADALYEEGLGAIPLLRHGRRAMALSAALYREILRQIERDGFGLRPGRVVVPAQRTRRLIVKHRLLSA